MIIPSYPFLKVRIWPVLNLNTITCSLLIAGVSPVVAWVLVPPLAVSLGREDGLHPRLRTSARAHSYTCALGRACACLCTGLYTIHVPKDICWNYRENIRYPFYARTHKTYMLARAHTQTQTHTPINPPTHTPTYPPPHTHTHLPKHTHAPPPLSPHTPYPPTLFFKVRAK